MAQNKIDPGEFLNGEVSPRIFDRLPAVYPQFGWKRIGRGWRATDDRYTHEVLGVRAERVECMAPTKGPGGFLIYAGAGGHDFWTWTRFENGGTEPKGRQRMDVIKRLADLAGVDASILGRPLTEADKAEMAARRRELEAQAAERARLEAIDQEAKRRASAEIWKFAGTFGHEGMDLAAGYLRGRGIQVGAEGVALPKSIRGIPAGKWIQEPYPNDEGFVRVEGPVVVCGMVRAGSVVALQRIYLDPQHPTRKRKEGKGKPQAKLTLGEPAGASVPLGTGEIRVLALTEGVETGMAVAQAAQGMAGVFVAACVSTSGLITFEPPEIDGLEEIVIMGDHDEWVEATMQERHRPGERTAVRAAERLAQMCKVPVRVAIPGHELCPEKIAEDGSRRV